MSLALDSIVMVVSVSGEKELFIVAECEDKDGHVKLRPIGGGWIISRPSHELTFVREG